MFKDYNVNQLVLPLDLEVKLYKNDIAFHVHQLVECIPQEAFEPFIQHEGCPALHPRMMLKIILCAYVMYNPFSRGGKSKLENEMVLVLMAVYLRRFTVSS